METCGLTPEQAFGSRLRAERERRGWRLEDLATHMTNHGLTRHESFYAKIETGATRIKLNEAATIARALSLSLSQMTTDHRDELSSQLKMVTDEIKHAQMMAEVAAMNLTQATQRRNELLATLAAIESSQAQQATPDTDEQT